MLTRMYAVVKTNGIRCVERVVFIMILRTLAYTSGEGFRGRESILYRPTSPLGRVGFIYRFRQILPGGWNRRSGDAFLNQNKAHAGFRSGPLNAFVLALSTKGAAHTSHGQRPWS